jgi:ribosomal protein S12 methylthiotransferase accessory factor
LYHPYRRLLWIEGVDLVRRESIWVPYELVHMDFTLPLPPGSGCFPLSSNGLASGNNLLEAASHAIAETIERDSTSLWMLRDDAARRDTKVRLDTVDDETCLALLERFERADVGVVVWDTTSDIGVASFLCTITQRSPDPWRPVLSATGMGCHPSRPIALARALTEAAQSRLTYIAGSRDDAFRRKYARSHEQRLLRFFRSELEVPAERDFGDVPSLEAGTLNEDVQWQLTRLQSAGVGRVVVVNLTKPEFRVPVVRVLVSGLEGSDEAAGYTPGRRGRALLRSRQ